MQSHISWPKKVKIHQNWMNNNIIKIQWKTHKKLWYSHGRRLGGFPRALERGTNHGEEICWYNCECTPLIQPTGLYKHSISCILVGSNNLSTITIWTINLWVSTLVAWKPRKLTSSSTIFSTGPWAKILPVNQLSCQSCPTNGSTCLRMVQWCR